MNSHNVFVGREFEAKTIESFLGEDVTDNKTNKLVVRGDSGTGKTYLIKECLFRFSQKSRDENFILYADLSNDEFQSSKLLSSLISMSMIQCELSEKLPIHIPNGSSLKEYREHEQKISSKGWDVLKGVSQAVATSFGLGGAANTALQSFGKTPGTQEEILETYLDWVSRKHLILIAIDNCQFMNFSVRVQISAIVKALGNRVRLIYIERTIKGKSELDPALFSTEDYKIVKIDRFSEAETKEVVSLSIAEQGQRLDQLSSDIYTKTLGNAKDIEYCLKKYNLDAELGEGCDVLSLLATIHKLPLMHRQILLIASLLDGGIHKDVAKKVLKRICVGGDEEIDQALSRLLSLQYLKINSDTGVRLRAGHERIIQVMRDLDNDEIFDDVRRGIIEEFTNLIDQNFSDEEALYILHCLVGLQTAIELKNNLHLVSRLVREQYREEQFAYIVNLADEAQDILVFLPQDVIGIVLDSMQKTSSFERGLVFIRRVQEIKAFSENDINIYRYKFLAQLYNYSEAEKAAHELPDTKWSAVYKINTLLSLGKDFDARDLAQKHMCTPANSEEDAVIMRNTVTLFDVDEALKNLDQAEAYFKREESDFRVATVNTNRGLVYLCQGQLGDACRVLSTSVELMEKIKSKEVFQAKFNLAIARGLAGNFEQCIEELNEALNKVPALLVLDKVKIKLAIAVFDYISEKCNAKDTTLRLESFLKEIKGIDLPYLRKTINYNLSVLSLSATDQYNDVFMVPENRATLYLQVKSNKETLVLNPSVHWRY